MAKKPTRARNSDALGGAASVAQTIAKTVASRRKNSEGISIHVHVGDLFLIGFDEAIDAEEWGARETNHEGTGDAAAKRAAEPERRTKRRLSVRKGGVHVTADEDAEPAGPNRPSRLKPSKGARRGSAQRR